MNPKRDYTVAFCEELLETHVLQGLEKAKTESTTAIPVSGSLTVSF